MISLLDYLDLFPGLNDLRINNSEHKSIASGKKIHIGYLIIIKDS